MYTFKREKRDPISILPTSEFSCPFQQQKMNFYAFSTCTRWVSCAIFRTKWCLYHIGSKIRLSVKWGPTFTCCENGDGILYFVAKNFTKIRLRKPYENSFFPKRIQKAYFGGRNEKMLFLFAPVHKRLTFVVLTTPNFIIHDRHRYKYSIFSFGGGTTFSWDVWRDTNILWMSMDIQFCRLERLIFRSPVNRGLGFLLLGPNKCCIL